MLGQVSDDNFYILSGDEHWVLIHTGGENKLQTEGA